MSSWRFPVTPSGLCGLLVSEPRVYTRGYNMSFLRDSLQVRKTGWKHRRHLIKFFLVGRSSSLLRVRRRWRLRRTTC